MSTDRTIEIIFAGVDNLSSTLTTMGGNVEGFGQGLQDFGAPFADAAEKVLLLQAALAAIAVGGLTLAATKAGEFSDGMAEINTLLNISDEEFAEFGDDILEYSTKSTASLGDLQSAFYSMISLGGDYADSIEAVTVVEKLSVGAKADMTSTTKTLVGTMNAYGAEMGEASDYSDAFFTIIKDGNTTLPELSSSISGVTGIAGTAGIPFETLGAAIAAVTAYGAPTSEAMTRIKSAITALVAPTEATSAAAKKYGVNIGQAAIDTDGFEGVLKSLYVQTGGNIAKMTEIIPSIEGVQGALALGADATGIFAKALEDMGNNTGATEAAFDKMKDNLGLIWQTMTNNFDAMFIKLGLSLGDESKALLEGFTKLFGSIGDSLSAGDFDSIISAIKGFMTEITKAVTDTAENIPAALKKIDFTDLLESYSKMKDVFKDIFGDVDLTSVDGLKNAIGFVKDALITLNEITTGLVGIFTPLVEGIIDLTTWFNKLDGDSKLLVGQIVGIGTALGALGAIVVPAGNLIVGFGKLVGLFTPAGALIVGLGTIATLVYKMRDAFKDYSEISAADEIKSLSEAFDTLDSQDIEVLLNVDYVDAEEAKKAMDLIPTEVKAEITAALNSGDLEGASKLLANAFDDVNAIIDVNLSGDDPIAMIDDFDAKAALDKNLEIVAKMSADEDSITETQSKFETVGRRADGSPIIVEIPVSTEGVDDAKKEIEDIPTEKFLEIKLQGDIDIELASIEAQAETLQSAMEWTAKVDIAQAEAAAQQVSSAFEAASSTIESTSQAASDMFSSLASNMGDMSTGDKWFMQDILEEQMDMEQQALDMQKELTAAQVEYMEAKTEAMNSGEGAHIQIDGTNMSPTLQLFLDEILTEWQGHIVADQAAAQLLGL